jgi:uncharacterized protein YndB with AHSA1/START domain
MTHTIDAGTEIRPAPTRISRIFAAPRATVFKAWSHADHVKRWFAPDGYSVPQANIHMHAGGAFEVCMRAPDGTDHWSRGTFAEVAEPERLVIDMYAEDSKGHRLFRAVTEVTFTETTLPHRNFQSDEGTRIDVVQTYTVFDARALPMIGGANAGWGQTLDKLGAEIERMQGLTEVKRSVVHSTFHLERTYGSPVGRVYKAISDEAAKSKWFGRADARLQIIERTMDFRVGGRERLQGRWEGGVVSTFDAAYHDIIPNERVVYTYEMHLDDKKISVSLATMQLVPLGPSRTTLKVTEQGAFLDGYDDAGSREHGTGLLMDALGRSLHDLV